MGSFVWWAGRPAVALFGGGWCSPPFLLCAAYQSAIIYVFPRGVALFDATVNVFLHLLCISCPMDLQCPVKAVTINKSK